jgi:flagellar biosynthesis chaperone FliJ
MKAFRFRLETVRGLRKQAERSARLELAHALARREDSAAAAHAAGERLAAAQADLAAAASVDAGALASRQAFVERLERERADARAGLAAQEQIVSGEAVDRLEERQRSRHAQAVARAEEAELGEVALALNRRRGGAGA